MSETFQHLVDGLGDEGTFLDRRPYPAFVLEFKAPEKEKTSSVDTGRWKVIPRGAKTPEDVEEEEGEETCVLAPTASKEVFAGPGAERITETLELGQELDAGEDEADRDRGEEPEGTIAAHATRQPVERQ